MSRSSLPQALVPAAQRIISSLARRQAPAACKSSLDAGCGAQPAGKQLLHRSRKRRRMPLPAAARKGRKSFLDKADVLGPLCFLEDSDRTAWPQPLWISAGQARCRTRPPPCILLKLVPPSPACPPPRRPAGDWLAPLRPRGGGQLRMRPGTQRRSTCGR